MLLIRNIHEKVIIMEVSCETLSLPTINCSCDAVNITQEIGIRISNCAESKVQGFLTDMFHSAAPYNFVSLAILLSSLRIIPPEVAQWPGMMSLRITGNNMHRLVKIDCTFKKLDWLDFSNNSIRHIEPVFFQSFPKLTDLNLSPNKLSAISVELLNYVTSSDITSNIIDFTYNEITHGSDSPEDNPPYCDDVNTATCCAASQIYLQHNSITHFTDIFHGWGYNITQMECMVKKGFSLLNVNSNPIVCDCTDCLIYKWIFEVEEQLVPMRHCHCLDKYPYATVWSVTDFDAVNCTVVKDCPSGCTCTSFGCQLSFIIICEMLEVFPHQLPDTVYE